jgi:hypothetical protein
LEKAKRLREQGKIEEADRELEQANRWENELRRLIAVNPGESGTSLHECAAPNDR